MSGVWEWYNDVMYNKADKRTADWFLMNGPVPIITILATYLYFCNSAGPRYMRDKKPYSLRNTLIVYNFLQVVASLYVIYEGLAAGWGGQINFVCDPIDYSNDPTASRLAGACHLYFLCKVTELLDTVFFVFRKKQRQISFLHLYHHTIMPLVSWIGVRYFAGGHATFFGLLNTMIHVVMYSYYMLAALGPEVQKYLWWKKHLTALQIVQFTIILVQNSLSLISGCDYPRILTLLMMLNATAFIFMFGSFYFQNYKASSPSRDAVRSSKPVTNGSVSRKTD